jgi:hypothetical protein
MPRIESCSSRFSLLLLPAILVTACSRPNYAETWPDRVALSAGAQPGYAIKQVLEKDGPQTLVADDGSICRTSRERFAGTAEGKWIACLWQLPSLDSSGFAIGR